MATPSKETALRALRDAYISGEITFEQLDVATAAIINGVAARQVNFHRAHDAADTAVRSVR